ncbi:UDP-N-acetylmuramate dehydrogenase [Pseudalkalibacillus caeni]|uniref:UDP-N-acetylenolpyruvoylglucosamine reductase n=1 Tax=Exobacillus caeni TaxID=2574798 RepID=A0A5R9F450_9BACL|nr:UDP-N-acetylmuramate dehydrogenase [Pseudalkalibacillus caeni]TLS35244.1 UDP-N-acetylmuramate dehydrogenase [Pseudalkalibacillus caeni]
MDKLSLLQDKMEQEGLGRIRRNEPMAKHTTIRIGGPAELLIEPKDTGSLKKVIELVNESGIKWRAIGRGSNLLVKDTGIDGIVIKLSKGMDHMVLNGNELRVGGGYSLIKLVTLISKKGLSGFEFAGGIPGSVGGAVFMNAGAHGSDIATILKKALILFEDGTLKWLTNKEMVFSYRTSILQKKPGIVVEAVFQLKEGDRDKIVGEMQKYKEYRSETQPWTEPCCGSVFRNPLPEHAGHLIERSGLKGYRVGGAKISEKHANFIVNVENASAKDVITIIDFVKETIKNKYGVDMHTEVEIVES